MKILLDNREYTFDNVEQRNDTIYLKSNFKFSSILSSFQLKYDDFINLIKNSLDDYVNIPDNNLFDTIEEYFNYFKITTNPLVRRNMASKIAYILINKINNINEEMKDKIYNLINSYKSNSKDKHYIFIKIMLKLSSVESTINEKLDIFDEEYFNLIDFILDYNN